MSDDPGNKSEELKKQILSSLNTSFTGDATKRWITAMKDDAFDEVEEETVSGASEGTKLNHSMAAVVDRLFDNFKRYSFEFNRTQDNREYEISCERPASMRTSAEYLDMGRPIKYCLGHLASRNWSLIIQGEENRIFVYITPIEYLVGFRPSPKDFPPHLEMHLSRGKDKSSREFVWCLGDQMLSQDSLPVLARRLFAQLVKVTKGEASYGEPFSLSPQEEKLALSQAMNAPIDRTFEEDESMLLGQRKPDLAERTFVVATEQVEQLTAALASGQHPAGQFERPPFNAMLSPSPAPSSLSASSSYPQVAAAIANGEPKALNPPIDPAGSFPRSQSEAEQAETFPKIPAQDLAPALAPARTFVAEPAQLSNDDAIAALIFPEPPGERAEAMPAAAESPTLPQAADMELTAPAYVPAPAYNPAPAYDPAPAYVPEPEAPVPQVQAQTASPWVGPNGEPARIPTPSRTAMEIPTQAAQNNGHSDLAKETAEAKANIAQSLKGLFESVDKAISQLTAIGMEAMHADDLTTVSDVMKQTKSLKSFRDSVVGLSKDWQKFAE